MSDDQFRFFSRRLTDPAFEEDSQGRAEDAKEYDENFEGIGVLREWTEPHLGRVNKRDSHSSNKTLFVHWIAPLRGALDGERSLR